MKRKILSVLAVLIAVLIAVLTLAACEAPSAEAGSTGGSSEILSTGQGGEPSASESAAESGGNGEQSSEEDEDENRVTLMTIHSAKGLEFPVVFVAGMGKQFNLRDADRFLHADNEFGIGVDFVDPVKRIRNKTLRKMILSQKLKRDTLAEELRILYVALTRAREKLILTATGDYSHDMVETRRAAGLLSTGKLNYLEFMKASCYMDFLAISRTLSHSYHIQ